jgi:thiamine-phosphate pyrophosphorylase
VHDLPSPPVQLITGAWRDIPDLRTRVEAALRAGILWVQLRAKERAARELYEAAVAIAPLLREAGALLVVNDRVDVALSAGAGGVHLPENGMSPADARRLLGSGAWIARSVHSVAAIDACASDAALDAVQFGPVFDPLSKPAFSAPQGLDALASAAARSTRLHLLAVGGITAERHASCRQAGAAAVSVIGAVWDAEDIEAAARSFATIAARPPRA